MRGKQDVYRFLFDDIRISITQAGSCNEAIDMFLLYVFDTIRLDIALPDGSGITLLRKFKKENPDIKVIMITNYPSVEFKKNCMELGADNFINKSDMARLIKIMS